MMMMIIIIIRNILWPAGYGIIYVIARAFANAAHNNNIMCSPMPARHNIATGYIACSRVALTARRTTTYISLNVLNLRLIKVTKIAFQCKRA